LDKGNIVDRVRVGDHRFRTRVLPARVVASDEVLP
jgi:hypothetical protein